MNKSDWGPKWGRVDTSSLKGYSTTPEIESYLQQFEKAGITPPAQQQKKVGTLQKIFGILSRGETAPAVMAAIKDENALSSWLESTFGPEPEQRITYSDVLTELGWNPTNPVEKGAKFVTGLVLDIFLDPKTYITFGVGGAAKAVVKVGGKEASIALSKQGSKFVAKTAKEFGEELSEKLTAKGIQFTPLELANAAHKHAIRELGAKIASGEGTKFLAKDGLKFMGKQILSKDLVEAPIKGAERLIEKVPAINKLYEGTRKAFEPFYEIKKLPTPISSKAENMFTFYPKAIRAEQRQTLEDITSISQKMSKISKKDLNNIIESASANRANQLFSKYMKNLNTVYEKEAVRNISKDLIDQVWYINPKAAEYIKKINIKNVSSFDDYFNKILKVLPKKLQTKELVDDGIKPLLQKGKDILFPQMLEQRQIQLIRSGIFDQYQKKIAEQLRNKPVQEIMSELYEKGAKTGYKEIDDVLELVGKRMEKIWAEEAERGIIEKKLVNPYLRHTLTPEAKNAILEGKDILSGMGKPLRIRLGASKPRQIMSTIKEANEWSVKNLGYKLFEEDIFKAWGVREFEHVAAIRTYDFLNDLGKTFGNVYEPVQKTVKTASGKLVKKDVYPEKVVDGIKYITSKAPQLEGMYFPEAIAKRIDDVYGTLTNDETLKSFINAYDKALKFWKGTVTGIWPAFHTRNLIGGSFNNFIEDGLLPGKWAKTTEKILKGQDGEFITKTGEKLSYKDILKNYLYRGGSQPGTIDVVREMDDLLNAGKISKKIKNAPAMAMEAVENRLRLPLFLNRLWKGDNYDDAMKAVYRSHFDYAPEALTSFERNVMKRLIPFYTYVRNNIPYQLGQLIKQPGKYAALAKTQRDFNNLTPEAKEEMSYMPNWMSEMFLLRLPVNEQRLYLQLDLPIEDLAKLPLTEDGVREIFSLLSPVLKYPIELIANRNIYFGSDIYDKDLPPEFRTSSTLKELSKLPEPIKKWLNFHEGVRKNYMTGEYEPYFEMDSVKLYTIRTFLGRFYSSFDQALQEDMPLWGKLSRLVGGIPVRKFDLEEEKYKREKEYERLLRELSTYYKQRQMMPYASEKGSFRVPMQ